MSKKELLALIAKKIENYHNSNSNKTSGLMSGRTGQCLFFTNLYFKTGEEKYLKLVEDFVSEMVVDPSPFLQFGRHSIGEGISGFFWFLFFLEKNGLLDNADELIDDNWYDILFNWTAAELDKNNWDFLVGALGIVTTLGKRQPRFYNLFEEKMMQTIEEGEDGTVFWRSRLYPEKANVGLAHGLPGILYYMGKHSPKKHFELGHSQKLIRAILNTKLPAAATQFPAFAGDERPARLAWCYGGLSIAKVLSGKNEAFIPFHDEALAIGLNTVGIKSLNDAGVEDACICHGSSGLVLMYQKMYARYGNEVFLKAAEHWEELMKQQLIDTDFNFLYKRNNTWAKDYSLLEGLSGVGLVLIGIDNGWDECLMMS